MIKGAKIKLFGRELMYEYIFTFIVGIACITLGILNTRGHISMIHSYHRKRVSEENKLPFGRLIGSGIITIGGGISVSAVLSAISLLSDTVLLQGIGYGAMVTTLVVGIALIVAAMIKYNKGIF